MVAFLSIHREGWCHLQVFLGSDIMSSLGVIFLHYFSLTSHRSSSRKFEIPPANFLLSDTKASKLAILLWLPSNGHLRIFFIKLDGLFLLFEGFNSPPIFFVYFFKNPDFSASLELFSPGFQKDQSCLSKAPTDKYLWKKINHFICIWRKEDQFMLQYTLLVFEMVTHQKLSWWRLSYLTASDKA